MGPWCHWIESTLRGRAMPICGKKWLVSLLKSLNEMNELKANEVDMVFDELVLAWGKQRNKPKAE